MRRLLVLALSVVLACSSSPPRTDPQPTASTTSTSTTPPTPVDPADAALPLESGITQGKLDNGLTYYILHHEKPEKRAQLWLAVNAGSVLEDDDQRGIAHFVEHMAFNGTKRFPKQEIVDFLEKTGVRFGADLNAHTSFDETVYTLQVPSDDARVMDKAVSVLRDWSDGVTFDPVEVDKERDVVLEEWRRGRGARARIFDQQAPVLFHASKYAERLPIGKPEVLKTVSRDTLVRFYQDWYRPDLMAVIAVGDFSVPDMEARIKREFGSLAAPKKDARARKSPEVPAHTDRLVTIVTDPEQPTTVVSVTTKLPHRDQRSANDYRRALTEQLYCSMLNARFDELKRQNDAPFLWAASAVTGIVRTADGFSQSAGVREDGVERGYAALIEESLRVERHGFTAGELERAKQAMVRSFEQMVVESDKRQATEYAAEIVRNFLTDEAMPGRAAELDLVKKLLPTIELDELDKLGKVLGAGSRVIAVTGPMTMVKPTQEAMLAMDDDVAKRDIKPYIDASPTGPLLATIPKKGAIAKTKSISELGVTEWTLDNGVHVVVKPTDFKNDDVRISAFSPGGTSLVKDDDFISAEFADEAVRQGGIGPYDAVMLRKALAGKIVSLSTNIGELEEGFSGRASQADLETLFQLVYLSFTAPRIDKEAFDGWRSREVESIRNRRLSPDRLFFEEMVALGSQNHLRRRPPTPEILGKIDLDKAAAIYRDRFADASDFTFVVVGNVDLDKLGELATTYLASLPSTKRKENWKDVNVQPPKGVQTKTVTKGSEPRSAFQLYFHGDEKWSRDTENDMRMLSEAMQMRLRQVLREDMGGVYGVSAGGSISRRPKQRYVFSVSFNCAPDNVEKLKKAVFDEIKSIQTQGVSDDYIQKIKETWRRSHEVAMKDNGFWLGALEEAYTFGDDPKLILEFQPLVDKVSSDRIKAAATKYLNDKQYIVGVLVPESQPAAKSP
ncbi:MAG: insulinase family protein [Polyangiaceae bacterium]